MTVADPRPTTIEPAPANAGAGFTLAELRRVGTAASMIVIGGSIIIIAMTIAMGHYNSLAHTLPKAVLDGTVVAMLMGQRGRWRCLALLGAVYGLVLLLQIGVAYLLPVMIIAGSVGALAGRVTEVLHRGAAVVVAAMLFELLAGFGAPLKIYFATGGESEPFVWGLWFAEWPLRLGGAATGVWLASRRWASSSSNAHTTPAMGVAAGSEIDLPSPHKRGVRVKGVAAAGIRVTASILACVAPMMFDSLPVLSLLAGVSLIYALWAGLRWRILHVLFGLFWGWVILSTLSYLWHHDLSRAVDMLRTFVLRFMPLMMASVVLVSTARPVDVLRFLRRLRVGAIVLIPVAGVIRSIPQSHREMRYAIARLKQEGVWKGPWSILRHPVLIGRTLLGPQFHRWRTELMED